MNSGFIFVVYFTFIFSIVHFYLYVRVNLFQCALHHTICLLYSLISVPYQMVVLELESAYLYLFFPYSLSRDIYKFTFYLCEEVHLWGALTTAWVIEWSGLRALERCSMLSIYFMWHNPTCYLSSPDISKVDGKILRTLFMVGLELIGDQCENVTFCFEIEISQSSKPSSTDCYYCI